MVKQRSKFICQQCGFETLRWLGRCPECGAWNSLVEEVVDQGGTDRGHSEISQGPLSLSNVEALDVKRLDLGFHELNRVLGGGLVPGSVVLLAGDPGIGKSTLLLQAASYAARKLSKVLYISGEESAQQIKLRSARMGEADSGVLVWAETRIELVEKEIRNSHPSLVIIDSIQTTFTSEISSSPGSVSQIKESAASLLQLAKSLQIPIIIVGHITKDGNIAGPRVLEHMVDVVLYFEGERYQQFRLLRAIKNRFGSTFELGVFEMKPEGLVEVMNPSQFFLAERPLAVPGSVVAACMEGTRPIFVEIQALVSKSSFGQPRRMTAGTDYNRVNLLIAVLEKRVGLSLSYQDVYVNIVGGIKIQEPALDLSIAVALASSYKNRPSLPELVVMGEVGLTGEVRSIPYLEKRIQEAKKLGFTKCLVPKRGGNLEKFKDLEIIEVSSVGEALEIALL